MMRLALVRSLNGKKETEFERARKNTVRRRRWRFAALMVLLRSGRVLADAIKLATQELENNVCRQFGWSARYFIVRSDDQTKDGCWAVKIKMGLDREKTFVSTDRSNDSNKYRKQGKKAAALVALEGLHDDIQRELIKPIVGLKEAVGPLMAGTSLRVCESSDEVWNKFWRNPPDAVGIDTEGNALSPPVLVQIATDDKIILEAPNASGLSWNLVQLLFDDSIVKVFCDSRSQRDKKSLGLVPSVPGLVLPLHTDNGPVVDIEVLADERMGAASVERGLSKLLALIMPELGVRVTKESGAKRLKDIEIFVDIEQGLRPPLRSIHEITKEQQNYAALDAWCTLQIWRQLKE